MNHYEILSLPPPPSLSSPPSSSSSSRTAAPQNDDSHYHQVSPAPPTQLPTAQIKKAYHAALLRWHPDKLPRSSLPPPPPTLTSTPPEPPLQRPAPAHSQQIPTVQQIRTAYSILSSPPLKAHYDRSLSLSLSSPLARAHDLGAVEVSVRGAESMDLDDMARDEESGGWWGVCPRCCPDCDSGSGSAASGPSSASSASSAAAAAAEGRRHASGSGDRAVGFWVSDEALAEVVGAMGVGGDGDDDDDDDGDEGGESSGGRGRSASRGEGEVAVQCEGCSLWIRVGFAVA